MKKKNIVIFSIVAVITVILVTAIFVTYNIHVNNEQREQINQEKFSQNVARPDRIVYKNLEKYYQINPEDDLYNTIIEEMAKKIDTSKKETIITQEEVDNMHQADSFIEFDYNTISKNYILKIDNKGTFVKLLDSGADLIESNIPNVNQIQKIIEDRINKTEYYTMSENKEYTSKNLIDGIQYKYLQQFKQVENGAIYQKVIEDSETLELYTSMCNLKFDEEITPNIFEKNVIVLTLSIPRDIKVNINIGNIRYYYDNKINNYEYTAHLLVVSKIVNSSCIYNVNNAAIKEEAELKDYETNYDNNVNNIDENVFQKNSTSSLNTNTSISTNSTSSSNVNKQITKQEADEIAEDGFKQAENIVGQYSKDSQTSEIQEVYANNFFTRKYNETDRVYNDKKIKCYVYTRQDEMGNGVSVYIDIETGKIVGGRAFGD